MSDKTVDRAEARKREFQKFVALVGRSGPAPSLTTKAATA